MIQSFTFSEVKQLLQNNSEPLRPNADGRIELILVYNGQNGQAALPGTSNGVSKSDRHHKPSLPAHLLGFPPGVSSMCGDLDVCGGQRVSMVTAEPSVSGAGSYLSSEFVFLHAVHGFRRMSDFFSTTNRQDIGGKSEAESSTQNLCRNFPPLFQFPHSSLVISAGLMTELSAAAP